MELVLLALGLFFYVLPVAALILALRALDRCRKLEAKMSGSRPAADPEGGFAPLPALPPLPVAGEPSAATARVAPAAAGLPASPSPGTGLEERLGTRLPVWIGSVALFLAGAFLVKLSFDRGWLGPSTRVILGTVFGIVLLGLGEGLRIRLERIAQGLSAAGIAVLYASLMAAVSLYHLVPANSGFVLLAVITALAVLLSLRQGMFIALLGLLGGFVTPLLIGAREPQAHLLFLYLFSLQAGLFALSRFRGWWSLSLLTVAGGGAWVLGWVFTAPADAEVLAVFTLGGAALAALAGILAPRAPELPGRGAEWLVNAGAGLNLALLGLLVRQSQFAAFEWAFFGLLAAGSLVLARMRDECRLLPWLANGAGFLLFTLWRTPGGDVPGDFPGTLSLFGALMVLGSFAAAFGSPRKSEWALLGSLGAAFFFAAGWGAYHFPAPGWTWGGVGFGLGLLHAAAAVVVGLNRRRSPDHEQAFSRLALAAAGWAAAAVGLASEGFGLTGLWGAGVPALILAGRFCKLERQRQAAAVLSGLVIARLAAHPLVFSYPIHGAPFLNNYLPGFGLPAAALIAAAWLLRAEGGRTGHDLHETGAAGLWALGVLYQVQAVFHLPAAGGEFHFPFSIVPAEGGTMLAFLLVLGWVYWEAHRALGRPALEAGALLVFGGALVLAAGGLFFNPLWTGAAVGERWIWNGLIPAYGVPALALTLFSWRAASCLAHRWAAGAGGAGLVFWFHFVSLEIRQAFQGSCLAGGAAGPLELYAYSAAWVLFGVLLLVCGAWLKSSPLRWCSLLVMSLAVSKVFLVDLAELRDFFRVLSLLGLGISLMVLAFVYQRFVFGRLRPR